MKNKFDLQVIKKIGPALIPSNSLENKFLVKFLSEVKDEDGNLLLIMVQQHPYG